MERSFVHIGTSDGMTRTKILRPVSAWHGSDTVLYSGWAASDNQFNLRASRFPTCLDNDTLLCEHQLWPTIYVLLMLEFSRTARLTLPSWSILSPLLASYRSSLSGSSWYPWYQIRSKKCHVYCCCFVDNWTDLNLVLVWFSTTTWPKGCCLHWECLPLLPNWTQSGTELSLLSTWKFYWYWKFVRRSTTGSKMPAGDNIT